MSPIELKYHASPGIDKNYLTEVHSNQTVKDDKKNII
jgi:hypothetical protein